MGQIMSVGQPEKRDKAFLETYLNQIPGEDSKILDKGTKEQRSWATVTHLMGSVRYEQLVVTIDLSSSVLCIMVWSTSDDIPHYKESMEQVVQTFSASDN